MEWRSQVNQLKGARQQLLDQIEILEEKNIERKKHIRRIDKAREVIKEVALSTQSQLTYNISEITSLALESVLDNPYTIELDFIERRNKTECDIKLSREDVEIHPYDGGGGALDVAAFALRVALWSMQSPRTRPTLILDEPFKHLKGEETNRRMLEMVKDLSEKLDIQIIMVSDERVSREATIQHTDKLFETNIKQGVTSIIVYGT